MQASNSKEELVLESKCPICEGAGGHEERRQWQSCYFCDGAGYLPTESGKRILDLVRHNFAILHRNAVETDAD